MDSIILPLWIIAVATAGTFLYNMICFFWRYVGKYFKS